MKITISCMLIACSLKIWPILRMPTKTFDWLGGFVGLLVLAFEVTRSVSSVDISVKCRLQERIEAVCSSLKEGLWMLTCTSRHYLSISSTIIYSGGLSHANFLWELFLFCTWWIQDHKEMAPTRAAWSSQKLYSMQAGARDMQYMECSLWYGFPWHKCYLN